ncbi:hypothetical protein LOD99_1706 [Oopsacas minuta]|uniref:Uncharacterized protein n=1 Tax=Oopsacas minuta TaxID=111878 RepID=A0AAV7K3Z5_9METZ|nr:hypothetical protein LOD99_1706 [Oopsacas minuta]
MAEHYPIALKSETHINYTIDGLIGLLNVRRAQLLELVRNIREDKRAAEIAKQQMTAQLTEAQVLLQGALRENPLQSMQEIMAQEMEDKLRDLRNNALIETQLKLQCDTRDLETSISQVGEIVQVPVGVPDYAKFQTSTVATGKKGYGPGELYYPYGVAIHEDTHQIFVADCGNKRVEIFSHCSIGYILAKVRDNYFDTWCYVRRGHVIYSCIFTDTTPCVHQVARGYLQMVARFVVTCLKFFMIYYKNIDFHTLLIEI